MKRLLPFLLLFIFIAGCKKVGDTPSKPDGPATPSVSKKISNIIIAPELPLQGKGKEFYVGVQYSKNYTENDQVSLTMNGLSGIVVKTSYVESSGWHALFKFPAVNQTGIFKLKATVKNSSFSLSNEMDYKVIDDLSIRSVWDGLTKLYYLNVEFDLLRNNDGEFSIKPRSVINEAGGVNYILNGQFTDDYNPANSFRAPRIFIPGLEGEYYLTFSGDNLTQIRVVHGVKADVAFMTGKKYQELEAAFGKPTLTRDRYNRDINVYSYQGFNINGFDDPQVMYTEITKK